MAAKDAATGDAGSMWALSLAAAAALLAGCGSSAPAGEAQRAQAESLPSVDSGHRPGPDILYAGAADAPQLQNTGIWKAEPILVSGAVAYRGGEFLYQDFLYDDHGAMGVPDPNAPVSANAFLFAPSAGTFTYPTDPAYVNSAADLVEFRVKPLGDATAFRVTLNSLTDPDRVAFTFALGGKAGTSVSWPHGAGVSSPADLFLTVHGASAELANAAGGIVATLPAGVDMTRRQYEIRVPRSDWDPGQGKVRVTIGVGLWDSPGGAYLVPAAGPASATAAGGGLPTGVALFNVGPRLAEPFPDLNDPASTVTIGDSAAGAAEQARWWRERDQANQLQLGDVSPFFAEVDFAKLAAGSDDDSGVPSQGPINRILASHYAFGQGLDPSKVCFDLATQFSAGAQCLGRYVGQLQPYALYLPGKPQPAKGWGMTLLLHSLSANYNQYAGSNNMSQLGERGPGSLVATPAGRGPDGFYAGIAEADTFEVWADVARHYRLDPDWSAVSGYSMGGFGTYRLLARWPDLFARGFSVVGIPTTSNPADPTLANLRNTPLLAWNAVADELVRVDQSQQTEQAMADLGLRFTWWLFPAADHLTLATNDEYGPGAEFLGTARVDRNPAHVTYVIKPGDDNAQATTVADHAYWVSGVTVRDAAGGVGSLDVRSEGFGVGDPAATGVQNGAGALTGGNHEAMPYLSFTQDWGAAPAAPIADALDIVATNIATVTIDPARARVSCNATLKVQSDGPLDVVLEGCRGGKLP